MEPENNPEELQGDAAEPDPEKTEEQTAAFFVEADEVHPTFAARPRDGVATSHAASLAPSTTALAEFFFFSAARH